MLRLGGVREDSEDTVIRERRPLSGAPVSDSDAFADTVLRDAPPPLIEPRELAPSGEWKRALTGDLAGQLTGPLTPAVPSDFSAMTEPHEPPTRRSPAPPPSVDSVAMPVHSIRVGSSEFSLEAPAFIGRHPSTPRIMGSSAVRLVRVPSPSREISSTHVSIEQEGSSIVVTDLGSTNGTTIVAPGAHPVALRTGDSVVVLPGTLVDLGDSVVIEVLAATEVAHD